jgi:small subunit ribosomal protein S11
MAEEIKKPAEAAAPAAAALPPLRVLMPLKAKARPPRPARRRSNAPSSKASLTSIRPSITRSSPSPTPKATSLPGAALAPSAIKARRKPLRSRRNSPAKPLASRRSIRAYARSMSTSKARVRAANPPCALLAAVGLQVLSIEDTTPIPHNGCRPPKRPRG